GRLVLSNKMAALLLSSTHSFALPCFSGMLITCTSSMRMETMGISGNEGGATHKWTKPVPHPRAALLSPSSFSFPYKNGKCSNALAELRHGSCPGK
ncbi:putative Protein CASP isoform b protein, partial [Naja naja]